MRDATAGEIPATALRLAELASQHGWAVRCTYVAQDDGKESVAVRLQREVRLWGVWLDGKFSTGACSRPLERMNVTQMKARVSS